MSTIQHQTPSPTRRLGRATAAIGFVAAAAVAAVPSAHAQAIDTGSLSQAAGSLSAASSMLESTNTGTASATTPATLEAEANAVRGEAGSPAWTHSDEMQTMAQRWAEHLVAEKKIYHQQITNGGENITCGWGAIQSPQQVVRGWAGEVAPNDGHKKILLEKRLTTMGFGVASSGGYWCVVLDAR